MKMDNYPRSNMYNIESSAGAYMRRPTSDLQVFAATVAGQNNQPPPAQSNTEKKPRRKPRKPYEEIGAFFNGNEVKIRVPKSVVKPARLTPSQQKIADTCTCEDDESVCSDSCGLDGGNGRKENKLNFQIPDDICESMTNRTEHNSEVIYSRKNAHDQLCKVCNVTPKDAPKGLQAQKVLHPDKDVFLLKIGKQTDEPNRTGSIEVELVTPRAPGKQKPLPHNCVQIQCEEDELPCCMPCKVCRPCPKKRKPKRRCCLTTC